jgi:hypothetical protein
MQGEETMVDLNVRKWQWRSMHMYTVCTLYVHVGLS